MTAISPDDFRKHLIEYLASQLHSRDAAEAIAPALMESAFDWRPRTIAPAKIDRIVAYAFGNRLDPKDPKAFPFPGPVNEELADTVMQLYRIKPVRIYAQWEIARYLQGKHALKDVVSIEPVKRPDGNYEYLSTDGVARASVAHEGGDGAVMGVVGIIAHFDHMQRSVDWSRLRGMNAFIPEGISMPTTYDPLSGHEWTRRRDIYLMHDIVTRLQMLRTNAINKLLG